MADRPPTPSDASRSARRAPAPLDQAALERLALRYVERFATTRGRLADYLARKLRARGWAGEGEPDPAAVAERMASLGYVDDRAFAAARAASMARRGLGARRVAAALRHAGVQEADADAVQPAVEDERVRSALAFARRKRFGPWAAAAPERDALDRQLAAMARAGHGYALSRRILLLEPGAEVEEDALL